jgi:hypothetical protein
MKLAKKLGKKLIFFIFGLIGGLAILGVNFWLIYPWFFGQGPVNLGSIEVSYVSMARFIVDFWPHLSWAPYWYFGFPFHLFYTPLLPFFEVVLNKLGGLSFWQAYRIVSGAGFVLAPVSLFLFTWSLTKKIVPGILAGFLYTFLPSLFYFILPSGEVAADIISAEPKFFDPRRLVILARWGEGPHTFSLMFLPLAGLFYLRVLEKGKWWDVVLAALFLGLTALTNAIGFYATILLLLAIFFSELVKKPKANKRIIKLSLLTGALAYGLIAFWYNLSFVGTFFGEGGGVLKNYLYLFPWGYVFLIIGGMGLYYFFKKAIKNREIIVSLAWFTILFLIVYVYYTSAPSSLPELRIQLVPQALRLMTEVDMALSVFLATVFGVFLSFLEKKHKGTLMIGNLIGLFLIGGILSYGLLYFPSSQKAVSGEVDLSRTGEYEIASWLADNVGQEKGERVYVVGNYSFFLNYFTDIWQVNGGLYQAMTHYWPGHLYYQVNQGKNKEIAMSWLKAANVKYVVVNTGASRELYKDYKFPEKFEDLEIVYEEKGDIIYELPLKTTGPVKVVDLGAMASLGAPKKADDKPPIFAYEGWLEKSSPASFEMINNDFYKIRAQVDSGEGILVQMTYDKGFRASSEQGKIGIKRDPLGFMVLVPLKAGEYEITLKHGRVWPLWLGYLTTMGTMASLVLLPILWKKRQRK